MIVLVALIAGGAGALWGRRHGPLLWVYPRFLYAQHQCATNTLPADEVVYEEDPIAARALLTRSEYTPVDVPWVHSYRLWGLPPSPPVAAARQWPWFLGELYHAAPRNTMRSSVRAPSWVPLLFLHERRTSGGVARIVAVARQGESDPAFYPSPGMGRHCTVYNYLLFEPSYRMTPRVREFERVSAAPVFRDGPRQSAGPVQYRSALRFFAGQLDANDPSRFYLPYEIDGVRKQVTVRLVERGINVVLEFEGEE